MATRSVLLCLTSLACANLATAAAADPYAASYLGAEAKLSGAVGVTVNLKTLSLAELGDPRKRALPREQFQRLLAELGDEIWEDGRWENSVGQAGFFVTDKGLQILKRSENAASFWPTQADSTKLRRMQPGYQAIEAALESADSVWVSILLRNESLDYSIERDGSATFQTTKAAHDEHLERADRLIAQFRSRIAKDARPAFVAMAGLSAATAGAAGKTLVVQVDKKTLHALALSPDVNRIEPADYADARPQVLDREAIEVAKRDGSVELLLTLRTPMPLVGLSIAEHRKMKAANQRAFSAMLAEHGLLRNYRDLSEFGVVAARFTLAQLQRLYASNDRRLLATSLNRPLGGTLLATSTVQMNLPTYWNADATLFPPAIYPDAGYRGAYPVTFQQPQGPHIPISIVVMDSGVQRTHPMLNGRVRSLSPTGA